MLATLKIRDLVLIEDVALDFAPGLNVLTGETGAGKSILLDALGLAAGARAGASGQTQRIEQNGFPRAGLAREDVKTRREIQRHVLDQNEVTNFERREHTPIL